MNLGLNLPLRPNLKTPLMGATFQNIRSYISKLQVSTPCVDVAFLSNVSGTHPHSDFLDSLIGDSDHFRSYQLSLTYLVPTQRGPAPFPIQGLKRCHSNSGLEAQLPLKLNTQGRSMSSKIWFRCFVCPSVQVTSSH